MSNDNFLKSLNFFQKKPERAKEMSQIHEDTSLVLAAIFFSFYGFILFFMGVENSIQYGKILSGLFLLSCMTILVITLYIEKMNKPFKNFSYKVYTGNPVDLFGDLSSHNIAEHLDEIKRDLKFYAGIRGATAYSILLSINDPHKQAARKQSEEANKIIADIENIQNHN